MTDIASHRLMATSTPPLVHGPRSNVGGPRSNVGGPRSNVGGPRSNVGGPRSNVGGPTKTAHATPNTAISLGDFAHDIKAVLDNINVTPAGHHPTATASARHGSGGISGGGGEMFSKVMVSLNFAIAAFGFAFAVVNTVYLSSIQTDCAGYNEEEKGFLYAASILFSIFFGLMTILAVHGVALAFK